MNEHYFTVEPSSKLKLGLLNARILGLEFKFMTAAGVFSHRRVDTGTRVLIEFMRVPEKGKVLDLGCGLGVIGIYIAATHPHIQVFMTDINRRAIRLAAENVKLNRVNAITKWGDLYEPVKGTRFDAIISNPPISAGLNLIKKMVEGASNSLELQGELQLVARTTKGGRTVSRIMESVFHNVDEIGKRSGYRIYSSIKEE